MSKRKKNDFGLTSEEIAMEKSFERGEWVSVKGKARDEVAAITKQAAKNYLQKNKRINIRLSSFDLNQLKAKSVREGLPYQTMISSILHKVASGLLDDRLNVHGRSKED
jgi:predicted DNA binding CopG/RHH family protein